MAHGGMDKQAGEAYIKQLGSYVKPFNANRYEELLQSLPLDWGLGASKQEQKERMLAAIEECRWEAGPECNSAMHTVLDVLQYLVERT